jgi:hypothetical protein
MWTCTKCQERIEDGFDTCWNCGTSRAGVEDPEFEAEEGADTRGGTAGRDVDCLRCNTALDFVGVRNFHEGTRWGVIGNLAELFVRTEGFEVYVCSRCGHVEFFAAGMP